MKPNLSITFISDNVEANGNLFVSLKTPMLIYMYFLYVNLGRLYNLTI